MAEAAARKAILPVSTVYAPHAPFDRPMRMVNDFNGVTIPKPASFDEYLEGYPGKPKGVRDALNKLAPNSSNRTNPARSRSW